MRTMWKIGVAALLFGLSVSSAQAAAITCQPSNERVATLDSATSCKTANGTIINSSVDLNTVLGTNYAWVAEGTLSPVADTIGTVVDDLLTITLLTGSWGHSPVTGTWAVDPSFWQTYGMGAITLHVGEGQGDPDAFAWLITPGETSGTFSYEDLDHTGGGLSNFRLFGTEPPTTTTTTTTTGSGGAGNVPEPNTGLLSLVGMLSVGGARLWSRRSTAQKAR